MPINMAPETRLESNTAITINPKTLTAALADRKLPKATNVAGLATTNPAFFSPMKAMNTPTPAETAE